MRELWWARLDSNSPRYADWKRILGTDKVPLLSPGSGQTKLGEETAEVYLLNWPGLDTEQQSRLLDFLAKKFDSPIEPIKADLDRDGHFPIRAADVSVAFDMRAFL